MAWRDELISTRTEAEDFLRREVRTMSPSPIELVDLRKDRPAPETVFITANFTDPLHKGDDARNPLTLLLRNNGPVAVLEVCSMREGFQGKLLGSKCMKAVLGCISEWGCEIIEFESACGKGVEFWCGFGALPYVAPRNLSTVLDEEVSLAAGALSEGERRLFRSLCDVADSNCYQGWRLLSQADLSGSARTVRKKVLAKFSEDENLYLAPSEPWAKAILTKRLGLLPGFRPLVTDSSFHAITNKLSLPQAEASGFAL